MKYSILLFVALVYVVICFRPTEGFYMNPTTSYILLLREQDLDMINNFTDYSNNYIVFDLSTSTALQNFLVTYESVVKDIPNFVDVFSRKTQPSYLTVTRDKSKVTLGSTEIPPSVLYASTVTSNTLDKKYLNGIMLHKVKTTDTWSWKVLASEVSKADICKINDKC